MRYPQYLCATTVLLVLSSVLMACGHRTYTFQLPQREVANRNVHPGRVAVIVDKEFMPYKIKFKYWSSPIFTWPFEGLPDAFVKTLLPYFLSVERGQVGRNIAGEHYDLIARMSIDRLDFDGANSTIGDDKVDLTMTFAIEKPDGMAVFRTTVSASGSSPYRQRCEFCKPEPPEAFIKAFNAAFVKLSEALDRPSSLH